MSESEFKNTEIFHGHYRNMTLTPELQKMFEEKTKKLSMEFHQVNCCKDEINDFDKIKECLEKAKPYINHFQDYYLPMIEKTAGLYGMLEDLKPKKYDYLNICHEFSDIPNDADTNELMECLKKACKYIEEFEKDLKELGFKV